MPTPYRTPPRPPLKFPPLARAGLFFEGSLNMQAQVGFGPINADADAQLRNIDLWNMTADVNPLNMGVEGEVRASLDTGAYVAASAWFVHDKFVSVQGGVRLALPAQIRGPLATKFKGMQYKVGEGRTGPEARLKQDLVLELKVALNPYLQLTLGDGWFETPLTQMPTIAEYPLLPPKKIAELSLNLADFDPMDIDGLLEKSIYDLATAPDAAAKDVSETVGDKHESVPPPIPAAAQSALAGEADAGPFKLAELFEKIRQPYEDNPAFKAIMAFVTLLGKISDVLNWPEKQVLAWLADKGILQRLKGQWSKLEEFATRARDWAFSKLSELWTLIREFFTLGGSEGDGEESEAGLEPPSLPVSEAPRAYELKLGASNLRVMAKQDGAGTISRNRLWDEDAKEGLELKSASLKLSPESRLEGGTLEGRIPMGELGSVEGLTLAFDADGRVSPDFKGAGLNVTNEKFAGSVPKSAGGSLENTQTRLWKVSFDFQTEHKLPEMLGAEDLKSPPANLVIEKRDTQWVIVGGAVLFKGGTLVYDVKDLSHGPKGVKAKGMMRLTLDMLGEAQAEAEIEDDELKDLTLKFKTNAIPLPKEDPWLRLTPAGSLRVTGNRLVDAQVRLHGEGKTEQLNKGQPFKFDGGVTLDEEQRASFEGKLDEKTPITVMQDAVVIKKLTATRDAGKGFAAAGEAEVKLPAKEPFTAAVSYDSGNFAVNARDVPGSGDVAIRDLSISRTKDGWGIGAGVRITNLTGFEAIDALMFYNQKKYGFSVQSVEATKVPGVETKVELGSLEYDTSSETFSGAGKIDALVPVVGPMTAAVKIDKSRISEAMFALKGVSEVRIPDKEPYIFGTYGGGFSYSEGQIGGVAAGDLSFGAPGIPDAEKPVLKFELKVSRGVTGSIKKAGAKGRINDFLELTALDLKLEEKTVKAFPGLSGMGSGSRQPRILSPGGMLGGVPQFGSQQAMMSVLMMGVGLAYLQQMTKKETFFSGTGAMKLSAGSKSGAIALKITDNEIERAETTLGLGEEKKDKLWGSLKAAYAGKTGLEFEGTLGMEVANGLYATGTLGYGGGEEDGGQKSLNARLKAETVLLEGKASRPLMTPISKSITLFPVTMPPVPPVMYIYARAGAGLSFDYEAKPPLSVAGDVGVQGINLADQTFRSADANLEIGGRLSAGLTAKPQLGLGAKLVTEEFGSLEGGAKFPITAEAASEPKLKTRLVYDETRKPRGRAQMNVPLSFGIKARVQPYAHVRALYGLVDKEWEFKQTEPVQLMTPREVFNYPVDFGNLEKKDTEEAAPKDEGDLKAASESEARAHAGKKSEIVETPREKKGEAPSSDGSLGPMGPFNMRTAMDKVKGTFKGLGDTIFNVWAGVKAVTQKVGALAYKAAEKLTSGTEKARQAARTLYSEAKKARDLAMDTVGGFVEWIKGSFRGDAQEAKDDVLPASELKDVPFIDKLPIPSFNQAIGIAIWAIWGAGVGTVIFPGLGTLIGGMLGGFVGWLNS